MPGPGRACDHQGSPPGPADHLLRCPVWALSSPEDAVAQRGAGVAPPHSAIGLARASLRGQDLAASLGADRAWWRGELTAAPHLHHGPAGVWEGLKEPRVAARGVESTAGPPCTRCQATRGEKPQQAPWTEITVMLKTTLVVCGSACGWKCQDWRGRFHSRLCGEERGEVRDGTYPLLQKAGWPRSSA